MILKHKEIVVLVVLSALLLWMLSSIYVVWSYFPNTKNLNEMNYSTIEEKFGKPAVVMEGKFFAWEHRAGIFRSSILISYEKVTSGDKKGLLIEKSLRLDIGGGSFRLYRMQ